MKVEEFINRAKSLINKTYSECDCIGVVRYAANIACQGTNWLWRSLNNSSKYRYLTERYAPIPDNMIKPGTLVFKIVFNKVPNGYNDKPDCYHVGILIDSKNVLHSSPSTGVRIAPFYAAEWEGCGWLKQVDPDENESSNNYDDIDIEEKFEVLRMVINDIYGYLHLERD